MANVHWRLSPVLKHGLLGILLGISAAASSYAQKAEKHGDVHSGKWVVEDEVAGGQSYRGETCLADSGGAPLVLKDLEFENGTIELDMALSRERGFLGVDFRVQSGGKRFERIYFRPHRSETPNAIQYDPHFNGYSNWQTYNPPLYEGKAILPNNGDWFHVKIEVAGSQARVFVGDEQEPQLVVRELMSGSSAGAVGLQGTGAYFANITIHPTDDSELTQRAAARDAQRQPLALGSGVLAQWRVSKPFVIPGHFTDEALRMDEIRRRMADTHYGNWKQTQPEDESGLINLNRLILDRPKENATVLAGIVLLSEEEQKKRFFFDSAEGIVVLLNGHQQYAGNDVIDGERPETWRVKPDEHSVELPLKKGRNELVLAVSSQRYGWAFLARLSDTHGLVMKPLTGPE